jgi:uncharacterized protein (TIGR03083 family)
MTKDHPPDPRDLLGAWALEALDEPDRERMDESVARDPELLAEARVLKAAVTHLAERDTVAPPAGGLDALMAAVGERPRQLIEPAPPMDVYASQVEALATLLGELGADDWRRPTAPYSWDVHGLVAHLLVIERYTADRLGLADPGSPAAVGPDGADEHHLRMGSATIAAELQDTPTATARRWHQTARLVVDTLRSGPAPEPATPVVFHGWEFTVEAVLIARAFELWTHGDDIRRATGRSLAQPSPRELRTMSGFSVGSLEQVAPLVAPDVDLGSTRVVLTGAGGGTFDLGRRAAGPLAARDLTLVVDVVDYCRLAARRIEPAELEASREGDPRIAHALLAAARVFAV